MPKFTQQDHIQFLLSWSKKKLHNGKSFEDLIHIDGIPLWFFVRTLFDPTLVPPIINFYGSLENRFSPYHQLKAEAASRFGPSYLLSQQKKLFQTFSKKQKKTQVADVLFLSYSNHIMHDKSLFRIQGLVDFVDASPNLRGDTYYVDPLMRKAYEKLLDKKTPYPFMDKKAILSAQKKAEHIYNQYASIPKSAFRHVMQTKHVDYYPALKYAMRFYFSIPFLTLIFLYYESFQKMLIESKYKVVVLSGMEGLFERTLICACKKLNIPCVLLQHGFGNRAYYPQELENISKYFVFGDAHKQEHLALGCDSKQFSVVGSLILSELEPFLKITPHTKHNLLLTSPFVEQGMMTAHTYFSRIKKIFETASKNALPLVVKLHPREEHLERYVALAQEIDPRIKVFKDISRKAYYEYLNNCSCFLSFGSTSQIEAMFLRKPMVTIDICGLAHTTLASPTLGSVCMWNESIHTTIEKSVQAYSRVEKIQQKFLKKQIHAIGEEANTLALHALSDMIKKRK